MAQPHSHDTQPASVHSMATTDENMQPSFKSQQPNAASIAGGATSSSNIPVRRPFNDITNSMHQAAASHQPQVSSWLPATQAAPQLHLQLPSRTVSNLLAPPPQLDDDIQEDLMEDVIDEDSVSHQGPHTMEVDVASSASSARHVHSDQSAPLHIDIDSATFATPLDVPEYSADIFANLKINEAKFLPPPRYLEGRNLDINASMRTILVDWLVEVAQEYRLSLQTLFLAVNYTDRLLTAMPVARQRLQLVGVTAMLIASKFFEVVPPPVEDFVYITDSTYSKSQVLSMEAVLLNKLQFNLTSVTCNDFLPRYLQAAQSDSISKDLAYYLCELTLQEYSLVGFRPSEITACAVILALHTLGRPAWTPTLSHYTGYDILQLIPCLRLMFDMYLNSQRSQVAAVRDKYSHASYHRVALIRPPQTFPAIPL